jgi:hypothetical protein
MLSIEESDGMVGTLAKLTISGYTFATLLRPSEFQHDPRLTDSRTGIGVTSTTNSPTSTLPLGTSMYAGSRPNAKHIPRPISDRSPIAHGKVPPHVTERKELGLSHALIVESPSPVTSLVVSNFRIWLLLNLADVPDQVMNPIARSNALAFDFRARVQPLMKAAVEGGETSVGSVVQRSRKWKGTGLHNKLKSYRPVPSTPQSMERN